MIDLASEVEGWAARWATTFNRAETRVRDPGGLARRVAEGVPVFALVSESWATRALKASGVALIYVPSTREIIALEVATGTWASRACIDPDPIEPPF